MKFAMALRSNRTSKLGRNMNRRDFVKLSGLASAGLSSLNVLEAATTGIQSNATLHIAPVSLEIAPGKVIKTVGYNGSVPGPILRFQEGKPVTIDVFNETDVPETVHWHGQHIAPAVDGSVEEGTPAVPAHGHRRFRFTPTPAGTRWYHTHSMAHADLTRAGFSANTDSRLSNRPGMPAITTRRSASLRITGSRRWHTWDRPTTAGRSPTVRQR